MLSTMTELKGLLLREPRWTLSIAESLTCGHLQALVGAVSGASNFFVGGITAYSLEQKVRHLGVERAAAARVACVSAEVAQQMAVGVCRLFGSDLGVSTTGYAEPSLDSRNPYSWWAVAHVSQGQVVDVHSGRFEFPGAGRVEAQRAIAEAVMRQLVEYVREARTKH